MKLKYIISLTLIFLYIVLHVYYPNEQQVLESYKNQEQWTDVKANFEDAQGDSYFLGYDSYFYVDQVNKINRGELTFGLAEDPILTSLVWLDYKLFGKFFLSHYYSAFFGLLCLIMVLWLINYFTNEAWCLLVGGLLVFSGKFFAMTAVGVLDTGIVHIFFLLLIFSLYILSKKYKNNTDLRWLFWGICILIIILFIIDWEYAYIFLSMILFCYLILSGVLCWKNFATYQKTISIIMLLFIPITFYLLEPQIGLIHRIIFYLTTLRGQVSELSFVDLDIISWAIVVISLLFMVWYLYKNRNQSGTDISMFILLSSFTLPLILIGVYMERFFVFGGVFCLIIFALLLKVRGRKLFSSEDNISIALVIFLLLFLVLCFAIVNLSHYNGGYLGIPLVDDGMVEAGLWIKENTPKDTVIITSWDYGIFYQTFAEREAKFRSTPSLSEQFYEFLYASSDETIQEKWKVISGGGVISYVIIVDGHFDDPKIVSRIKLNDFFPIPQDAMVYRLFQNRTPDNFTLAYHTVGAREQYFVYTVK